VGLFNLFRRAAPKPKARRGRGPKSADELAKLDERNDRRLYFRRNPAAQDVYIRKQLGIEDDRDPVVRAQRAAEQAIKEAEAAGHQAAARYIGGQHQIIERYTESIHGKGLLKSGLTVTANCADCHTAHQIAANA